MAVLPKDREMDKVEEEGEDSGLPLGMVEIRVARWWKRFKEETPQAKPTLEIVEKLIWPAWKAACFLAAIPMLLVAVAVIPLVKAASVLEHRGEVGRRLSWLFYGPTVVLILAARIAGWLITGWFLWRFATNEAIRKDVGAIIKFFTGIAILGGTIPLANALLWRLQGRLEIWGAPERVAGIIAQVAMYLFLFVFWGVLIYFGVVISLPR
jgi:hypothetical protein